MLFEAGTAPQDMAEICGHAAADVLPPVADTVRAIRTLEDGAAAGRDDTALLRFRPHGSGWSTARLDTARPRSGGSPLQAHALQARPGEYGFGAGTDEFRLIANAGLPPRNTAAPGLLADLPRGDEARRLPGGVAWETGADEFRFRGAAEVRK